MATCAARGQRILQGPHVVLDGHQTVWDGHGGLEGRDLGNRVLRKQSAQVLVNQHAGSKPEPPHPEENARKLQH